MALFVNAAASATSDTAASNMMIRSRASVIELAEF